VWEGRQVPSRVPENFQIQLVKWCKSMYFEESIASIFKAHLTFHTEIVISQNNTSPVTIKVAPHHITY
jgi:hypothetical protein